MLKYSIQRLLLMLMTLLIITCICFVLIRMLPPVELPIGDPHAAVIEARREALGYNKPYLVQFGIFLKEVFTKFDWGICDIGQYYGKPALPIFLEKLPPTIIVNFYSIILSIPIGIALGIFAALKKNTWIDHAISTLTMVVISVPSFVYAFLIQYFLSFKWGVFPFLMKGGTDYCLPFFRCPLERSQDLQEQHVPSLPRFLPVSLCFSHAQRDLQRHRQLYAMQ